MKWPLVELKKVVTIRSGSINPAQWAEEQFELFSIPGYDAGEPEVLNGSEIKSNKTIIKPGDVLFSKLNPRIPRIWIVPEGRGLRQSFGRLSATMSRLTEFILDISWSN